MAVNLDNNTNPWKLYYLGTNNVPVKARKSMGGGFYEIKVIETGMEGRYLADVFEINAREVPNEAN